jgi:hypothetical protein
MNVYMAAFQLVMQAVGLFSSLRQIEASPAPQS